MKKTRILSLLLCLSIFCTLIVPGTRAYADNAPDSGMKISKTATANKDGSYTITLEAFATGSKTTTVQEKDIPTDIILVLDQSGSMEYPIGGYTYTAYRDYYNEEYYQLRHNGGSENLWYKLNNNEYIAVSVEQKMEYTDISGWDNWKYYDNQNSLYCKVSGEYKSVTVKREGHLIIADEYWYTVDGQQILYTIGDDSIPNFGQYAPLYQSVKKYIYSYTLNGATTVIEESIGDGSSPDTQFYRRDYSSDAGGTKLNALKNAATTFANAVAAKAAGEDGDITTTADNIDHRIAVVGYAGSSSNLTNGFKQMNNTSQAADVLSAIDNLTANGGTHINQGLSTANGIFANNPIGDTENRNRVVIVFTDGAPGTYGDWRSESVQTANNAIAYAKTAKKPTSEGGYGATVYTIGIFSGADASNPDSLPAYTSYTTGRFGSEQSPSEADQVKNSNRFMHLVSSNYPAASSITQPGSINPNLNGKSYYLSAADSGALNNIFQQISNQIETGGAETTLGSETVVKDIISPYFTLPAGTTASGIRIDTYACTGKDGNTYTWSGTSGGNGGASATVNGDQVSVTGFDFSENWCGTEKDAQGNTTVRGKKLVISFEVSRKSGFLGGNDVITNASAGIYENGSAQTPVMTFEQPTVNVPIEDMTVTATDKNVYLKGSVTTDQLKSDATVKVGDVSLDLTKDNYGLADWQTEYVNITVMITDKDGKTFNTDDLTGLTEDKDFTVTVTVSPKTAGTTTPEKGNAATAKSGTDTKKINVFKPVLTFKDSTAYYGETVPTNNDFGGNKVSKVWKHDTTESTTVTMLGDKPALDITYTPDNSKIFDGKYGKADVPVKADVKIGGVDVNDYTTFEHQACDPACGWETPTKPGDPAFLIHINTCTLNITKQNGANDESYVFDVYKDGVKYSEVTVWGNGTETIVELPVGTYTIEEGTGWSWRYTANNGGSAALTAQSPTGSITCTNTKTNDQWLNGFSTVVRNIFGFKH